MDVILVPLAKLIVVVIDFYIWIIVAGVVLSWLTAFGVVNTSNRFVYLIGDFIYRVTEPLLSRIRRFMPDTGTIDISPVVLIMALWFLQTMVIQLMVKFF